MIWINLYLSCPSYWVPHWFGICWLISIDTSYHVHRLLKPIPFWFVCCLNEFKYLLLLHFFFFFQFLVLSDPSIWTNGKNIGMLETFIPKSPSLYFKKFSQVLDPLKDVSSLGRRRCGFRMLSSVAIWSLSIMIISTTD